MVIGLTGNIGSGKSSVAKILTGYGCYLINADHMGREVSTPNSPVCQKLKEVFGTAYFDEAGNLNRQKLGELVFANPAELTKLNAIMHPAIFARIRELIELNQQINPDQIILLEAAILLEADLPKKMPGVIDSIWLVCAWEEVRLARVMQRDKLSLEHAKNRLDSQMPESLKRQYADYTIENQGSLLELEREVAAVWKKFLHEHQKRG